MFVPLFLFIHGRHLKTTVQSHWRSQPKICGEGQNFTGLSSGAPRIRQGGEGVQPRRGGEAAGG